MIDIIVVGGGHAGVEAALVSARSNLKTVLITMSKDKIAQMPCNPSIGGPAKGVVVREIDALGGQMGITADKTALQFKMLNTTKGPGVQSLRVQSDKEAYSKEMIRVLEKQDNLEIVEGIVEKLIVDNGTVKGVEMNDGSQLMSQIVIMTTGTYMSSAMMVSDKVTECGPNGEPTSNGISQSLRDNGVKTFRLKTGTPARVLTDSIDFSKAEPQPGTDEFVCYSYKTEEVLPIDKQVLCYLIHTRPETHQIINDNLHRSSMYSGVVKGVGPRYCPSIEDKLVRFSDKERHQIFLEPESKSLDTTYVQGFSTSMPYEVQDRMIHSLPGLENAVISKYAYAIEYDAIDPLQLKVSLESMVINNLFTAGQINGTSGYEEAAGQGLIAGINAVLKLRNQEPLVLKRDEAYIGVMIDDLVTKGTNEPYRLLTSRAEFRLLLRHDNADQRLTEKGYQLGFVSIEQYNSYKAKMEKINDFKENLRNTKISKNDKLINEILIKFGFEELHEGINAYELVRRPHIKCEMIKDYFEFEYDDQIAKQVEIELKYEGYIEKAKKEASRMLKMDLTKIPEDINYDDVEHLSLEGRQKLKMVRPATMGQGSRISGVSPADIAVLAMYLKQNSKRRDNDGN